MNTRPDAAARRFAKKRLAIIIAGGIVGVAAGLAAVYGIGTLARNPDGDAVCRPALAEAKRIAPLARGEVAAMAPSTKPPSLANLSFQDADGRNRTLAEWKGRVVLLNLWATWCVPCRKEMPALDALQKKLGGPAFEVVAVNIDTRDPAKPKAWLSEVGITGLTYYADPTAKIFQDLKVAGRAFGMPTTILVDRQGCELASLAGPAEWASDDACALVQAALGP
jgi:thiol-disulfide isomerase/thioredoxin